MMSQYDTEKFCQPPDPDLICCICQCVLLSPVESPCRHVFCDVCITTWLTNHHNCPTCRRRVKKRHLKPVLPIVQNMINRLLMFCDFRNNGCTEKVLLEVYLTHVKTCGYQNIKCRFSRCDKMILLKDKDQHENKDCKFREKLCTGRCGLMIAVCMFDSHDCYEELQRFNKEKSEMVSKLQKKVKELNEMTEKLQKEVDRLKVQLQRRRWPMPFGDSWESDSQYTDSMYNFLGSSSDQDSNASSQEFAMTVTSNIPTSTVTTTSASANTENNGFREYVIYPSRRATTPVIQTPWPVYETRSTRYVYDIRSPSPVHQSSPNQALDLSNNTSQAVTRDLQLRIPDNTQNDIPNVEQNSPNTPPNDNRQDNVSNNNEGENNVMNQSNESLDYDDTSDSDNELNSSHSTLQGDDDTHNTTHNNTDDVNHHSDHTVYSLSDSGSERSPARWWRCSRSSVSHHSEHQSEVETGSRFSRSRSRSLNSMSRFSRSRSRSLDFMSSFSRSRSRSLDFMSRFSRSRSRSLDGMSRSSRSRSYSEESYRSVIINGRYLRFYPHTSRSRSPSVYSNDLIDRSRSNSYDSYHRSDSVRSRSRSYDSLRSTSSSHDFGRSRSGSYNNWRSHSRSDYGRSRSRSFDNNRSRSRSDDGDSSRSHYSRRRGRYHSRTRSRSRQYSRSRSHSSDTIRSRSSNHSGFSHSSLRSSLSSERMSRTPHRSLERSVSPVNSDRSVSLQHSPTMNSGFDDSDTSTMYSKSTDRKVTEDKNLHSSTLHRSESSDRSCHSSKQERDHEIAGPSLPQAIRTDFDSVESDSDRSYNFKRRKSKGINSNSNSDSGIGTEPSSQSSNSINHLLSECNAHVDSNENNNETNDINQRKRKNSATVCDKKTKRVCTGEESSENSDSDWVPSANDVEDDEDDDSSSDTGGSDSSYEVLVPKTTVDFMNEYNSDDTDDTWSPSQ